MMTESVETPHFPSLSATDVPRLCHDLDDPSFRNGTARHAWAYLGAHAEGEQVIFRLWAPHAIHVSIMGIDGDWSLGVPMVHAPMNGVWQATLPACRVPAGTIYKYRIVPRQGDALLTADPYGRAMELPPANATVFDPEVPFLWHDDGWMHRRLTRATEGGASPLNIYELHPAVWHCHNDGTPLSYHELADELAPYLKQMGFTHVLLCAITEPAFNALYAPTARYGTPDDLRTFVDILHGAGVGVLFDWAPVGISATRGEAHAFLLSNATYWVESFHADGLCLNPAVFEAEPLSIAIINPDVCDDPYQCEDCASNEACTRRPPWGDIARRVRKEHPDVLFIAPPTTTALKGDFSHLWHTAWVADTLEYAREDPIFRKHKHKRLIAHAAPATEMACVLPLSRSEVGHPLRSFLDHMPGDYWQKFAGARVFAAWVMTHPGAKLWSMGCEIGQFSSRDEGKPMEWYLLDFDAHARLQHYYAALNRLYLSLPPLWDIDPCDPAASFTWLVADNAEESILSFTRRAANGREVVVILNFTPVAREGYAMPMPAEGTYREIFNSDNLAYGGSDVINPRPLTAVVNEEIGRPTLTLRIPPLGCAILEPAIP